MKHYWKIISTKVNKEIRYQVNWFKTDDDEFVAKQNYKLHNKYQLLTDVNSDWVCDYITIVSKSKSNEKIWKLLDRILKGDYDSNTILGELI